MTELVYTFKPQELVTIIRNMKLGRNLDIGFYPEKIVISCIDGKGFTGLIRYSWRQEASSSSSGEKGSMGYANIDQNLLLKTLERYSDQETIKMKVYPEHDKIVLVNLKEEKKYVIPSNFGFYSRRIVTMDPLTDEEEPLTVINMGSDTLKSLLKDIQTIDTRVRLRITRGLEPNSPYNLEMQSQSSASFFSNQLCESESLVVESKEDYLERVFIVPAEVHNALKLFGNRVIVSFYKEYLVIINLPIDGKDRSQLILPLVLSGQES